METISFLVHGKTAASLSSDASHDFLKDLPGAQVKQSVKVGTLRGTDTGVVVTAEQGKDVVVIHIADGPSLMLNPETARDLFKAQEGPPELKRGGAAAFLQVPSSLAWDRKDAPVQQRGFFASRVTVCGFDLLTNVSAASADEVAAGLIVAKVDDQVDPGVYKLRPDALKPLKEFGDSFAQLAAPAGGGPMLVLLHGTFSSTHGTFGKLWEEHPDLVAALFRRYGDVYALDHPTLGASPINNALLLASTLPQGARLHLLTHSRGGLVGEVLARACSVDTPKGADLGLFSGAAHARDLSDLGALVALVKQRDIRVERIVRVACPARGTLLASKRLDAYISALKWGLELASIPVLPALIGFLGDVAQHKADPATIPGLAAQMPHSPLVQWLHGVKKPINGELRVIAGDVEGNSIGSWIKTLLTDAFFWTDNDFVVQTSSMYGGAPRVAPASFLLDKGGAVSHFAYFSNPRTARAVVDALTEETPAGFGVIGPLSAGGTDASGQRARRSDPSRPVVFILPGIMGSNLKVGGDRIWLGIGMLNGLDRLKYGVPGAPEVEPDGTVGMAYARLSQFLSGTHDVVEFAFDWRKPMELEAQRLALAITRELDLREKSKQPVRLLAHSMGGLLARVLQLKCPELWTRMIGRSGASVVMLGTPNGGSWAPMQMLSGDDSFGNALVAFGAPFRDGQARELVAGFPGLLQMQAGLLDPELGLGQEAAWQKLADKDREIAEAKSPWHKLPLQLQSFAWGVPPQSVLDGAVKLRKELDAQRDRGDLNARDKLTMVLGKAKFTPAGYTFHQKDGLMYLDAPDQGDGRVTVGSALLPGVPAWQVDCAHGMLAADERWFHGYLQLLETGKTTLLGHMLDYAAEKEKQLDRSRYVANRAARRAPSGPPVALEHFDSDAGRALEDDVVTPALALTVVNGNLKFVRHPVLLGHYRSSLLTGAEAAMDDLIGGSMGASIRMGLYPDAVRTHQIFLNLGEDEANPLQLPRPEAVIVVGLGAEGELTAAALASTVCNGVIGWAQRQAETLVGARGSFELSAALLGSGGPGISAGQAARSIAQGVSDANRHLLASHWPHVSHLYLTEKYLDRATDAWRALGILQESTRGRYRVGSQIANGTGAYRRDLQTGYRGATYDLMSAVSQDVDGKRDAMIVYSLDTKRAREEVRAQRLQGPLVKMLLKNAADCPNNDRQLGKTLFQLLVPPEVEPFMAGSGEMQIVLDTGTAGIPWEMLDTRAGKDPDQRKGAASGSPPETPWAIRVKLLRRLRTVDPASRTNDAGMAGDILVIGEPCCDPKQYPRLPGAWREATAVADTIRKARPEARLKALISEDVDTVGFDAPAIINTVFEGAWRVVHIAGHGALPSRQIKGGVVLSGDTFLSPDEIATMRVIPELVFLNCCHLGKLDDKLLLKPESERPARHDRPAEAAGIAQELIKKGVRCVVVAGWAVDDDTARLFATTFYSELMGSARFIDAVAEARTKAWNHDKNGKTWAAYQCYGDPNWRWTRPLDQKDAPPPSPGEEFDGIGSAPALLLALETVITDAHYHNDKRSECWTKVGRLQQRFGKTWGDIGVVAEAFGRAWSEARDLKKAIAWHRKAVGASDGSASIAALEQLGNVLVLAGWAGVQAVLDDTAETDQKRRRAALDQAIAIARPHLYEAISLLERLNGIHETPERLSLWASAQKRLAMLENATGNRAKGIAAVARMKQLYLKAEEMGKQRGSKDWFYPALNNLAAEVIAHLNAPLGKVFASENTPAVRRCIADKIHADPDFQSVVAQIQLDFYLALAAKSVRKELPAILKQYNDLYIRAKAPRYWNSVRDQLDFMLLLCGEVIPGDEQKACAQLRKRLGEIAPKVVIDWVPSEEPEDALA